MRSPAPGRSRSTGRDPCRPNERLRSPQSRRKRATRLSEGFFLAFSGGGAGGGWRGHPSILPTRASPKEEPRQTANRRSDLHLRNFKGVRRGVDGWRGADRSGEKRARNRSKQVTCLPFLPRVWRKQDHRPFFPPALVVRGWRRNRSKRAIELSFCCLASE